MTEHMKFLPKKDLLTLDELSRLCRIFIDAGVDKIRITGGEPLVRRNIMHLFAQLGELLGRTALRELTLTTNGTQLAKYAEDLFTHGVRRVNVSLDTLNADTFSYISRWGKLEQVLDGIHAARNAGLRVKINTVALKDTSIKEYLELIDYCALHDMDITFIEVMPMGDMGGENRFDQFLALTDLQYQLSQQIGLMPTDYNSGGPANYFNARDAKVRIGFIAPQSQNFCATCNRVRVTCTGRLYTCLGQSHQRDLRAILRANPDDDSAIQKAISDTVLSKRKGHDFFISKDRINIHAERHMSVTGG